MTDAFAFGDPPAQRHSATSRAAAQDAKKKAVTDRATILALLCSEGPMSDDRQQVITGLEGSTQRPRRIELTQAGLAYDTDQKELTRATKPAVMRAATARGRRVNSGEEPWPKVGNPEPVFEMIEYD